MTRKRQQKLSEDEAFEIAFRDHPELRKAFETGTMPEEITDEEGDAWNPALTFMFRVSLR